MANRIPLALLLAFSAGLWACNNSNLPVAPTVGTGGTTAAAVSFKADVQPLLAATCAGCHAAGQDGANELVLFNNGSVDYSAASGSLSKIVRETQRGDMPKGRAHLTTDQLGVLKAWQAAGAPNN
jgi:hypothetical protein